MSLFNSLTSETSEPCVFVMDNVAFHKTAEIRSIFENSMHEIVFLPPYSLFLNPIENIFSKWKNL
jgi:transposase